MNEEQSLWAIRAILKLEERVAILERKAEPMPPLPATEPERLPSVQAAERLGFAPFAYEERS